MNSLSGRLLILTIVFVMLAEVMIFVPSIARFRQDYMLNRLERAQIASLALLADDMLAPALEQELIRNAEVFNVVLRRNHVRELVLSSDMPKEVTNTFDMREPSSMTLIKDALRRLFDPKDEVIRVIGSPLREAGLQIEITMETAPMRAAMIDYGLRILMLSAAISVFTALLLFVAMRTFLLGPIKNVIGHMQSYAAAPEDARRIIKPAASARELREAEEALQIMQTELTQSLKQKDRLAQLGGAVSKVSHDLRNILTSAQLFTDRIESSNDPVVLRMAPKLVGSITRAIHLCESTLAFGKAEEPGPTLTRFRLSGIVDEVIDSESLAAGEYPLRFENKVEPDLMIRADPEQMYRIMTNLIRNARQAIVATGKAGKIDIRADETEEKWQIIVCDDGPGLPEKAQKHLFTPFQGGARQGGSGLGLAIAAELVRGHGGTLEMQKTSESGTCFALCFPRGESVVSP